MLFPDDEMLEVGQKDGFKRLEIAYANRSEKFLCRNKDFSKQFYHLYASRLEGMTKLLKKKIHDKYGDKYPIKQLCDLRENNPTKCFVIGTLYKQQEFKPSVLRELSEENQLAPQPPRPNYVGEDDQLILEDNLQRIMLIGEMSTDYLVTGIVCAVLGYEKTDGKFAVEDCIYYEGGKQRELIPLQSSPLLVLISSIDQSADADFTTSLELFQQWIFGNYDGIGEQRDWEAASVVRVIVAGNSVRSISEYKKKSLITRKLQASTKTIESVKSCDKIFSNWIKSVNVDVMPGEFDPSNFLLPQQPIHPCIFPKSATLQSFQCVTNPYCCELADRIVMGTSGQNINDIMKVTKIEDPIEALRLTLQWGHIAPTCPDTIPCYPYVSEDPFIIDECPHIYFTGNQPEFKTDLFEGSDNQKVRLICVPAFSETQSVVVVNLRTLECKTLSFKINGFEE